MEVVDLGRGLAVVGAEDAAGVLDESSLLGDGCGEEEGIQRRAVESFSGVWACREASRGGDLPDTVSSALELIRGGAAASRVHYSFRHLIAACRWAVT
jgi:hypothetical protein